MRTSKTVAGSNQNLASYIGSTAKILKKLMRTAPNLRTPVSAKISDKNPYFLRMIRMEAETTHLLNRLNENPGQFTTSLNHITSNLNELAKTKDNSDSFNFFATERGSLKAEVEQVSQQREQTVKKVTDFVREKNNLFPDVLQKLMQGYKNYSDLNEQLNQLQKSQFGLMEEIKKLRMNETQVQSRLNKLYHNTLNALPATARATFAAERDEASRLRG